MEANFIQDIYTSTQLLTTNPSIKNVLDVSKIYILLTVFELTSESSFNMVGAGWYVDVQVNHGLGS